MSAADVIGFAGGIGLFLLGMRLMSDGLKVAAGPALRSLLTAATRSGTRAVASGVLITALVQSSSAVIFATIGFVNAGLLNLVQAVGVIFGANVGTTLTSWIVALVGFNVDLQVLAMPAIATGMGLWILGRGRQTALGQALVGFGIFFLGLDVLKDSFSDLGQTVALDVLPHQGPLGILLFAVVGALLTVLMQSSSATLAVTLTAAAGGVLPLGAAAAMVVGAKVGTTSTALFAVFGATPAAKRAASAHVAFNLLAAVLALPALPWLLDASRVLADVVTGGAQPATVLAVFHTLTAFIALAVIWPLANPLVAWLQRRFVRAGEDEDSPRHLDRHVIGTPRLALDALARELARLGGIAHRMARSGLSGQTDAARLASEQASVERLAEAILGHVGHVGGSHDAVVDAALPDVVRVAQYYRGAAERAQDLGELGPVDGLGAELEPQLSQLLSAADHALAAADPNGPDALDPARIDDTQAAFATCYQDTKGALLRAGGRGQLGPATLVRVLDRASMLRRVVDQAGKAGRILAGLRSALDDGNAISADA